MKKKNTNKTDEERFKGSTLLKRIGGNDGMKVPDGYYEQFAARMAAALPERAELEYPSKIIVPRSTWHRMRPYVYMAAMFAGIWCMLKMFTLMSGSDSAASVIDSNPVLAEAIGSEAFVDEYVASDINQWDLVDEMLDEGFDPGMLGDGYADEDSADNALALPADPAQ